MVDWAPTAGLVHGSRPAFAQSLDLLPGTKDNDRPVGKLELRPRVLLHVVPVLDGEVAGALQISLGGWQIHRQFEEQDQLDAVDRAESRRATERWLDDVDHDVLDSGIGLQDGAQTTSATRLSPGEVWRQRPRESWYRLAHCHLLGPSVCPWTLCAP